MPRFRVRISYDGTQFHGWQIQPAMRTVQSVFRDMLERLGEETNPYGSGRTDAGVHALGNEAHFDMSRDWDPKDLQRALKSLSPLDVDFDDVQKVSPDFHARYDAAGRRYAYVFCRERTAFNSRRSFCPPTIPDEEWIRGELACLKDHRDFASLCQTGSDPGTTDCTIQDSQWWTFPKGAMLTVQANRFLYGMMRALVGTLLQGHHRGESGYLDDVLKKRSRSEAGPSAPPWGLYLVRAYYEGDPPLDLAWRSDLAAMAGINGGTHA